jgi:hypothetical protein
MCIHIFIIVKMTVSRSGVCSICSPNVHHIAITQQPMVPQDHFLTRLRIKNMMERRHVKTAGEKRHLFDRNRQYKKYRLNSRNKQLKS